MTEDRWSEERLREHVRGAAAAMAPFKDGAVTPSSRLVEDLGYDSLGLVELLIALEQDLGVSELGEEAGAEVECLSDLEDLVVAALLRTERLASP